MVDWRRLDWRGVTPQPPAATPGDWGNGETPDDDVDPWIQGPPEERRAARRRTALMVLVVVAVIAGLVVVAVIVSLVAYRRFQR